ncbi:hypothetical protein ABZP36_008001 [Zizania latifolia]
MQAGAHGLEQPELPFSHAVGGEEGIPEWRRWWGDAGAQGLKKEEEGLGPWLSISMDMEAQVEHADASAFPAKRGGNWRGLCGGAPREEVVRRRGLWPSAMAAAEAVVGLAVN